MGGLQRDATPVDVNVAAPFVHNLRRGRYERQIAS
jgi:hypothetical protein